jgi:hypothetical protein
MGSDGQRITLYSFLYCPFRCPKVLSPDQNRLKLPLNLTQVCFIDQLLIDMWHFRATLGLQDLSSDAVAV